MTLTFTAVFEEVSESEGGGYVAYVEELPGAITEADTIEEARENLQDAVNELLEANRMLASRSQAGHSVIRESITVDV
jgi:predicted RNase H-like HicB family nuclease